MDYENDFPLPKDDYDTFTSSQPPPPPPLDSDSYSHQQQSHQQQSHSQSHSPSLQSSQSHSHEDHASAIEVEVLPGDKHGDGMSGFVSYIVHTRTTLPQFKQSDFSKSRRYRDFLWLHTHLSDHFKSVIIPPLPEKSLIEKFSPDFIEFRRRELDRFLKRVVSHPSLATSPHLQTFLEAHDSQLQEAKQTQQGSGFLTQMTGFFGVKVMNSLAPAIEVDMWFDTKTRYINALEIHLNAIANPAGGIVYKSCELAEIYQDTAVGSSTLAHSEMESSKPLADSLNRLADAHSQMYTLTREFAAGTKVAFEDPLRDYIRLIGAVKVMLSYRLEKLAGYQEALASCKAKKDRLEKIKRDGGQVPVALNHELERIETLMERERETFESVSRNCRAELEKFEALKSKEIHQALVAVVQTSLNYQLRAIDLWKQFLREESNTS